MAVIFGIFVMVNQIFSSPTFEATASSLTQNATAKTFRISLTAARVHRTILISMLPRFAARTPSQVGDGAARHATAAEALQRKHNQSKS